MSYVRFNDEVYNDLLDQGLEQQDALWQAIERDKVGEIVLYCDADEDEEVDEDEEGEQ